jgi:hypothetical protein
MAVSRYRESRAECWGDECLDLRTEARRCAPAEDLAPEVAPRMSKRRRPNQMTSLTTEQARPCAHNPPPPPDPARTELPIIEPASVRGAGVDRAPPAIAHAGSSSTPQPFAETRGARNRRKRHARHGFFVEPFPDPSAGQPITEERMSPADLEAYMRSSGVFANPKNLETAELLMTTGLKDSGKERHLQSSLVRTIPVG